MSACVRYDMIGAAIEYHIKDHPQTNMKKMGYKVTNCEPITIADCWIFEVEELIKPLAPYLHVIKSDYFSKEE